MRPAPTAPETSPSGVEPTPTAGSHAWRVAVALGVVLAVFVPCWRNATAWVGRPFAGFLVLQNGIVVSIGRSDWMPGRHRRAEWTRVIAVDGRPIGGGAELVSYVGSREIGKRVTYTFRRGTEMFRLALEVRRFGWDDFADMLAPFLGIGLVMAVAAILVLAFRPRHPGAVGLAAICLALGLVLITSPDQYAPYRFNAVFFMSLATVPAAILHFDLAYPRPATWLRRRVLAIIYAPFVALGAGLVASMSESALFLALLYLVYFCTANAMLLGVGSMLLALIRGARPVAPLLLVVGAALGSAVPVAIVVTYPLLEHPISPIWLAAPLLLTPALIGTALVGFPVPEGPAPEAGS
jgi:hypothetical protein